MAGVLRLGGALAQLSTTVIAGNYVMEAWSVALTLVPRSATFNYSAGVPALVTTIDNYIGPIGFTVAQTTALGGIFADYEAEFVQNIEPQWTAFPGTDDYTSGGALYERGKIYYAWYARLHADNPSLAATYLARARALIVAHRDGYVTDANDNPVEALHQWTQLGLHALDTNSSIDRAHIGNWADTSYYRATHAFAGALDQFGAAATSYINSCSNSSMSTRMCAHFLAGVIAASATGAPSDGSSIDPGGHTWPADAVVILNEVLAAQRADGRWQYEDSQIGDYTSAFQMGLLCDRLIDYYRVVDADSRIPTAVKACQNYLWNTMVDDLSSTATSFWYQAQLPGISQADVGLADLNGFHLPACGWLYYTTGDTLWKTRGDALLTQMMVGDQSNTPPGATMYLYKQFSESFTSSYKYLWYRQATPLLTPAYPLSSVRAAVTPTSGAAGTLTCTTGTWTNSPSSHAYQWKRYNSNSSVALVGTNSNTISAAAGFRYFCVVTATNGSGASLPVKSNTTSVFS